MDDCHAINANETGQTFGAYYMQLVQINDQGIPYVLHTQSLLFLLKVHNHHASSQDWEVVNNTHSTNYKDMQNFGTWILFRNI